MRVFQAIFGVAAVASLAAVPAFAAPDGQRGGAHARPALAKAAPHAPAPKAAKTTTKPAMTKLTTKPSTTKALTPKPKSLSTASTTTRPAISPVAQKIARHPQLASRVRALLPAGLTLNRAAAGFKNQGQFIAALHVSRNLDIPFAQLKREMTGPHQRSLGQAIHALRPAGDAATAQHRAETEAHADLQTANFVKGKRDQRSALKPRGDSR
jgi:hypothetical protein